MSESIKLIHISDPHLQSGPSRFALNSRERLCAVVKTCQAECPDVLVITGDLTESGHGEDYEFLKSVFCDCSFAVVILGGNHDDEKRLKRVCADHILHDPKNELQKLRCADKVGFLKFRDSVFILIESWSKDRGAQISSAVIGEIESFRTKIDLAPVYVFLHHPPVRSGIAAMDAEPLKNSEAFLKAVRGIKNLKGLFCGHIHRSVCFIASGGVPVFTVRSVGLQVDRASAGEILYTKETAHLHVVRADHDYLASEFLEAY